MFLFGGCGTGYYTTYPDPTSCQCEPCPVGTYNNTETFHLQDVAQVTIVHTPDATSCVCKPCPVGTYNNMNFTDSCTVCPSGQTTSREGSTGIDQRGIGGTFLILKKCNGIFLEGYNTLINIHSRLRGNSTIL